MIRTILAGAAVSLMLTGAGSISARTLEMHDGAYEAALGSVVMPSSSAGTVIFRTCESCDPIGLSVSGATVYSVNGNSYALADFLSAVERARTAEGGSELPVGIFYDLETNRVTKISIYLPQSPRFRSPGRRDRR